MSPAVAVLDGKLYAVGGLGDGGALLSVERYNPAADEWRVVASMATATYSAGAAVLDGKLYAAGGRIEGGVLSSVARYDPARDSWEGVAPMATPLACPLAVFIPSV